HDSPFPALVLTDHDTAMVIREWSTLERSGRLRAVTHDGRLMAQGTDNYPCASGMIQPIVRGPNDRQNGLTVEGQAVRSNVEVVLRHQAFHGGSVLLQPCMTPALVQIMQLRQHRPLLLPLMRTSLGDPVSGRPLRPNELLAIAHSDA